MTDAKKALEAKWITFDAAVGKTIAKVDNDYDVIYVVYTDGTFTAITAQGDEDDATIEDVDRAWKFDAPTLHKVGLLSDDVFRAWDDEQKAEAAASEEAYRRRQYEELKARFEPNSPK